jgi:hypothetical protein
MLSNFIPKPDAQSIKQYTLHQHAPGAEPAMDEKKFMEKTFVAIRYRC